jgi:hypothetical protein
LEKKKGKKENQQEKIETNKNFKTYRKNSNNNIKKKKP